MNSRQRVLTELSHDTDVKEPQCSLVQHTDVRYASSNTILLHINMKWQMSKKPHVSQNQIIGISTTLKLYLLTETHSGATLNQDRVYILCLLGCGH